MQRFIIFICGLLLLSGTAFATEDAMPHGIIKHGPRTYRFTVKYSTANTRGEVLQQQIISADYTHDFSQGTALWTNISETDSVTGQPGSTTRQLTFMEGFHYSNDAANTSNSMSPDFFAGFPPTEVLARNLVWDTQMFEEFGQRQFEHLKLNQPYHLADESIDLPSVGTFRNRDVQLTWLGHSQRNGRECELIGYNAFFNPLNITNEAMNMTGRSHYWGVIWMSRADKQVEYATLYEDVLAEMKLAGQDQQQIISVFRSGTFEPLLGKRGGPKLPGK